jgi:hypothetical protein
MLPEVPFEDRGGKSAEVPIVKDFPVGFAVVEDVPAVLEALDEQAVATNAAMRSNTARSRRGRSRSDRERMDWCIV